jgi:hypothetical protein
MRFYTPLPLLIGVASASQQLLRSPKSAEITQAVTTKAAYTRNMLVQNKRDLLFDDDFFGNGSDFNLTDLGFDFGDLGSMDLCGGEPMELDNTVCTCSLKSGNTVLTNITTILENLDDIMTNGIDAWFECSTVDPMCYENECGTVDVTCNMTLDFTSQSADSSLDCNTCVNYTNAPSDYPAKGIMEGQTMCMSLELCLPEMTTAMTRGDASSMTMENVLCGCNATLNGKECTCGICDSSNGMFGVKIDCGDFVSTCTDTGFEMVNGTASVSKTTKFLPLFENSTTSDSSTSAAFAATAPFLMSGLVLALSFA